MHQFDSYVVSTYGRSGSVLVTSFLESHLKRKFGKSKSVFNQLEGLYDFQPILSQTVYHCHSLAQLDLLPAAENCGVIFTVRDPSICAISMILRRRLKVDHVHNPVWIDSLKQQMQDPQVSDVRLKYIQRVLDEHARWQNSAESKFHISMQEFQNVRNEVRRFNANAVTKLKSVNNRVTYLNYADWQGDLNKLSQCLGLEPMEIYMAHLRNDRHWSQNVSNSDELQNWVSSVAEEDQDLLIKWKTQLFTSGNATQ